VHITTFRMKAESCNFAECYANQKIGVNDRQEHFQIGNRAEFLWADRRRSNSWFARALFRIPERTGM
jgi:hypothetical protein